jgi:hypothetical protein
MASSPYSFIHQESIEATSFEREIADANRTANSSPATELFRTAIDSQKKEGNESSMVLSVQNCVTEQSKSAVVSPDRVVNSSLSSSEHDEGEIISQRFVSFEECMAVVKKIERQLDAISEDQQNQDKRNRELEKTLDYLETESAERRREQEILGRKIDRLYGYPR